MIKITQKHCLFVAIIYLLVCIRPIHSIIADILLALLTFILLVYTIVKLEKKKPIENKNYTFSVEVHDIYNSEWLHNYLIEITNEKLKNKILNWCKNRKNSCYVEYTQTSTGVTTIIVDSKTNDLINATDYDHW